MSAGYNGWANYETWLVKLWIDNSECDQEYWTNAAREALEEAQEDPDPHGIHSTAEQTARYALADQLKDSFEEAYFEVLPETHHASLFSDMLGAAFGEVNWGEIAEALIEDAA